MGQLYTLCLHCSRDDHHQEQDDASGEQKTYSWDKRERVNPQQFMFDGLEDTVNGKLPGSINGQQFIIQNCKNSSIYLFDHSASVTIDDCTDCKFLIGPCKGSVFIRDCSNCNFLVACQQFRTRDCKNLNLFLHCSTQPIIEASSTVKFACLQWSYAELANQYASSGLSVYNNIWSKVHDFTPVEGSLNYSLLPEDADGLTYVPIKQTETFVPPDVSTQPSLVPFTHGLRRKPAKEVLFLLFFSQKDQSASQTCTAFLKNVLKDPEIVLVQSKETNMQAADLERVLGSKAYNSFAEFGSVVGIELCGATSRSVCLEAINQMDLKAVIFVAEEGPQTSYLLHNFYSFCEMQMGM